jgi:peroxiredoxin
MNARDLSNRCREGIRLSPAVRATVLQGQRIVMPNLMDRLDALRAQATNVADVHDAYHAMLAELRRTPFLDQAVRVGDAFPDFLLPNAEGRLVARDDLLRRGPVVVTFFRGTWCPYCAVQLDALEEALPQIAATGASLAAITPETGGRAAEAKARHGAHYEILADVDQGLGIACGVVFRAPEPYRRLLLSRGIDLAERHGHSGWFLPVPATFVVNHAGVVSWAFIDVDFTRRAEPDDILAALAAL